MAEKKSVFVIDDSPYIRNFLEEILDEHFNIVGEAADGVAGLKGVLTKHPDIVLLDLMLPKMNGDAVAKAIMAASPTPILLMTSLTDTEIEKSFDVLETSVVDTIKKPSELDKDFSNKLINKLNIVSNIKVYKLSNHFYPSLKTEPVKNTIFTVLAIGISTGGPKVLKTILPALSKIENLAIVIIQHIEKDFEESLVDWIRSFVSKTTKLIKDNLALEDAIYIAPFSYNLTLTSSDDNIKFNLLPKNPGQIYHPSIDSAYENLAKVLENKLICLQMTGMGNDGKIGAEAAKKFNSKIIAQDPETAIAESMPKSVLHFADDVITLENIEEKILKQMK